jgi:hypothetical protein
MTAVSLLESDGHLAIALAVEGVLRAALTRRIDRTLPTARTATVMLAHVCEIAQVEPEAIDRLVHVQHPDAREEGAHLLGLELPRAAEIKVASPDAMLRLLWSSTPDDPALLVVDEHGCAGTAGNAAGRSRRFAGIDGIVGAARTLSMALGSSGRRPFAELEQHAQGTGDDSSISLDQVMRLQSDASFATAPAALADVLADARQNTVGSLGDPTSIHTSVERLRTTLAKRFLERLAQLIVEAAHQWRLSTDARSILIGGGLLSTPQLAALVRARVDSGGVAPIAYDFGAVLGGALMGQPRGRIVEHLCLGPRFNDHQIKEVIENCRLEYMYEPDWSRLCTRVSRWISGGSTVAWFQGALEFGGQSLSSRSVLADPSHRYARENLNLYLLGRPLSARLPVSLAPSAVEDCVTSPVQSPLGPALDVVRPHTRASLAAAVDSDFRCLIHVPTRAAAPELVSLLETHRARTGVPGLLNTNLERSPAELVETPRQAIRAAFGSAVDILVMGRFMVAKDYWLMRQQGE